MRCWLIVILIAPPSLYATQTNATLLVFGDSLSAGYGIEREQQWASLLQKRLQDTKIDVTVINHSISGEITAGGVARLPASLQEIRPDFLILALGANDGLRGLSLTAMKDNLQRMISMALKNRTRVILVGMKLPVNYGPAFNKLFHQQYADLARDNEVIFIPFLLERIGENIDWFQADGFHPTAAAQKQILAHVWDTLEPLLGKNRK